jgi:hypothetical protein
LREPFAKAFTALGFDGDEGWRVAARIKVVLLAGSGVGKPLVEPVEAEAASQGTDPNLSIKDIENAGVLESAEKGFALKGHDFSRAESVAKSTWALAPAESIPQPSRSLPPALWSDPDLRWLCGVHQADGHEYLVRESYEELLWWLQMPSLLRLAAQAVPSKSAVQSIAKSVEEALAAAEAVGYRVDLLLTPPDMEVEIEEPAAAPASATLPAAESETVVEAQELPLAEPKPE